MTEPVITNRTPFFQTQLHLADEEGTNILVVLVRATYRIHPSGRLSLHEEQQVSKPAGEYFGDPETSSYKFEPETAFIKPATDVVLIGHAHAPNAGAQVVDVGIKVGPVQKILRVFGDRYWVKTGGSVLATTPQPFQRMPLTYERAFGGWDRANKDETTWRCDNRNPVGRGFGDPLRFVEEGKVPMPNIEDPNQLIKRYGDQPPPAGFGFVSPHWQARAQYAGTYDQAWDEQRKPLLPKDFDRRFFNAASPGLVAPGYLRGDEDVVLVNVTAVTPLKFRLPAVQAPLCHVILSRGDAQTLQTKLDTVIIDADEMLLLLLWRAYMANPRGAHDFESIEVGVERDAAHAARAS